MFLATSLRSGRRRRRAPHRPSGNLVDRTEGRARRRSGFQPDGICSPTSHSIFALSDRIDSKGDRQRFRRLGMSDRGSRVALSPLLRPRWLRFRLSTALGLVVVAAVILAVSAHRRYESVPWQSNGGMIGWSQASMVARLGPPAQTFEQDMPDPEAHSIRVSPPTGPFRTLVFQYPRAIMMPGAQPTAAARGRIAPFPTRQNHRCEATRLWYNPA